MIENKKALNIESSTYEPIIPKADCTCNMPVILQELANTYQARFPNTSLEFTTNTILAKTFQMFTGKRIVLNKAGTIIIPNWYALIFAPSGYGKDRLVDSLDKNVFKDYSLWFKEKAKEYRNNEIERIKSIASEKYGDNEKTKNTFIETETSKIRNIVIDMSVGTQEGLYADCKAFSNASFGSAFVHIRELGNYMQATSTEREQFLNCLFEAYDGKIIAKCIKNEARGENIEDVPVNALLYSDFTLFQTQLKTTFSNLLNTGLNRRSVITFQTLNKLIFDDITSEKEQEFNNKFQELGKKLFSVFCKVKPNSCYVLEACAQNITLNNYKRDLIEQVNNTEAAGIRTELLSREMKALKLSCLFAAINHPEELVINQHDVQQAISTVEYLSSDFKEFVNFRPKTKDICDNLFDFILEKQNNEEITKTKLIYQYYKYFGISRKRFKDEFEENISIIKEIAKSKGFVLIEQSINNNSGTKYYLQSLNNISDESIPHLEDMLKK